MIDYETKILELETENKHLKHKLTDLQNSFEKVLLLNEELRLENKRLREENQLLREENTQLKARVAELEKKVEKLSVKSNEPSSKKADYEKANSNSPPIIRGRKKGHPGVSRKTPEDIDKKVHFAPSDCPKCHSKNLQSRKTRSRVITDIVIKTINIKEIFHDKTCQDCGCKVQAESPNGDSKSPFGKGVQILHTYLRTIGGMTLRPLEAFFSDLCNLKITNSSISNNEIRIAQNAKKEYDSYLEMVKEAKFSHKDETTWRINGKMHYVWVYDSLDTVFYRLADTRSKSVVEQDFGKSCKQISINDCYAGYNDFENQQNCWAHIFTETEAHAKKETTIKEEKIFYVELSELYKEALDFVDKDPPLEKRQEERANFENKLVKLMCSLKKKTDFLEHICNRLSDRLSYFSLFIEIPGLPPTNNQAERSLRSLVVHRKVSFGNHSFAGGETRMIFKTLIENTKRRGKSISEAIERLLFLPMADT